MTVQQNTAFNIGSLKRSLLSLKFLLTLGLLLIITEQVSSNNELQQKLYGFMQSSLAQPFDNECSMHFDTQFLNIENPSAPCALHNYMEEMEIQVHFFAKNYSTETNPLDNNKYKELAFKRSAFKFVLYMGKDDTEEAVTRIINANTSKLEKSLPALKGRIKYIKIYSWRNNSQAFSLIVNFIDFLLATTTIEEKANLLKNLDVKALEKKIIDKTCDDQSLFSLITFDTVEELTEYLLFLESMQVSMDEDNCLIGKDNDSNKPCIIFRKGIGFPTVLYDEACALLKDYKYHAAAEKFTEAAKRFHELKKDNSGKLCAHFAGACLEVEHKGKDSENSITILQDLEQIEDLEEIQDVNAFASEKLAEYSFLAFLRNLEYYEFSPSADNTELLGKEVLPSSSTSVVDAKSSLSSSAPAGAGTLVSLSMNRFKYIEIPKKAITYTKHEGKTEFQIHFPGFLLRLLSDEKSLKGLWKASIGKQSIKAFIEDQGDVFRVFLYDDIAHLSSLSLTKPLTSYIKNKTDQEQAALAKATRNKILYAVAIISAVGFGLVGAYNYLCNKPADLDKSEEDNEDFFKDNRPSTKE